MRKLILLCAMASVLLSSCYVNRVTVGYGPVGEELRTRTYSKTKQHYVLFGLIRTNHPLIAVPPTGVGYEIKSGFTFVDAVLTGITVGIYGQRTVKILVDKTVEKEIQQGQKNPGMKH